MESGLSAFLFETTTFPFSALREGLRDYSGMRNKFAFLPPPGRTSEHPSAQLHPGNTSFRQGLVARRLMPSGGDRRQGW